MYRLGYQNNNCIGCVKGGKGYWNKIREDFPETFWEMSKAERFVGHSCIKNCFLDELRSEEHTSELQSHSFISYAVFCLKKKNKKI